jgi:electron transfer flavoprotein alpha subunit
MVLVYSDSKNLTLEMLNKANEIARDLDVKVTAVVIGVSDDGVAKEYIAGGADKVFVAETDVVDFKAEEYTRILQGIVEETEPNVIFIGSNKNGKELAPRLAARLGTGCITDCIDVYLKDNKVVTERIVYSGNAVAVEEFVTTPGIVTVPSKLFDPLPKDEKRDGEVIRKKIDVEKSPSKILKIEEISLEGVNIEDAEIIVSCGRGFKKKEDIRLVEDLAEALKGKTIGCSRPIAADLKWLSEDHWVGLSGHKVKPKLYIAAGISGQIQHIAGMRDSKIIVAVNKDPEALIFKSADYGIIGDLYEVLPKLTDAIKQKMSS